MVAPQWQEVMKLVFKTVHTHRMGGEDNAVKDGRGHTTYTLLYIMERRMGGGHTIYTLLYIMERRMGGGHTIMGRKDLSKSSKSLCTDCQEPLVL